MEIRGSEKEIGIITEVQDGKAWVEIVPQAACENCGAKIFCTPDRTGKRKLKVQNDLQARVGQQVAIAESSNFLLYLSFLQYGLPGIGFISGILVLYLLDISLSFVPRELLLFTGGLGGLAVVALLSRSLLKKLAESGQAFFSVAEIL